MPSKSVLHPDLPLFVVGTRIDIGTGQGISHDAPNRYTNRCSIPDRDAGRECDPEIYFSSIDPNQDIT
jgi:hypothetical protein